MSISLEDFKAMYQNCLLMYQGRPVYVSNIANNVISSSGKFAILLFHIEKQAHETIAVNDDRDFSSLNRRLGYVNCMGSCAYVMRMPVRRYKVGLSNENIRVENLEVRHNVPKDFIRSALNELVFKGYADTLFNRYPTLRQAISLVKDKENAAVAFDRQFAIDRNLVVYYKNKQVGKLKNDKVVDSSGIVWNENKEYLVQLLDGNYEKTIRSIKN